VSKKKFTDGLESLFGIASDDEMQDNSPFLARTESTEQNVELVESSATAKKKSKRRRSGKNFTSDLDSLFDEVGVESSSSRAVLEPSPERPTTRTRLRRRKPVSGLDALIRGTVHPKPVEIEAQGRKRVTFVFDKHKLSKLKVIARSEKAYLKDIIGKVVGEYIEEYEKMNGEVIDGTP